MSVPDWARSPKRGRERESERERKESSSSYYRSTSTRKRSSTEEPEANAGRTKLGKTSGVIAIGAWSARHEIARMIQSGVSAQEILELIRNEEESDSPLQQGFSLREESKGPERKPGWHSREPLPKDSSKKEGEEPNAASGSRSVSTAVKSTPKTTQFTRKLQVLGSCRPSGPAQGSSSPWREKGQ